MLEQLWYLLLVAAGFLAGIINTVAGGGSFLTLPALMFIGGLDAQMANGTNRVAILFSSGAASLTFNDQGYLDKRLALRLTLPTLLGTPIGVLLAIYLPPSAFRPIFGLIFFAMALVILWDPKRISDATVKREASKATLFCVFFGIGVYVGFIQAGMGILLLVAMSLLHTGDLVASNAVKNLIGFSVTLAATLVFIAFGHVAWIPGLVTAIGNLAGGVVGAKLAINKGNKLIFGFLIVVMLATGTKLLLVG